MFNSRLRCQQLDYSLRYPNDVDFCGHLHKSLGIHSAMSELSPEAVLGIARELSPRRSTSTAKDVDGLVAEQLAHFSLDAKSDLGQALARLAGHLYRANVDLHELWELTVRELRGL